MQKIILLISSLFIIHIVYAQQQKDTTKTKELQEVIIRTWQWWDIGRLPEADNGFLNSGKKNEVITLSGTHANVAVKTGRQLFAKTPGVFVYDMDGSGNQLNISVRGLDPHRSWEFNTRQNGIIINSDMYGYPASHYSAPMESFEKIELVRGTGSLQYGAQFGGMINYQTKQSDTSKALTIESITTAGSFNLLSTYNAISGTYKKFSYYAYHYRRHSDGYRDNSESHASAQFVQLNYRFNQNVSVTAMLGRSKYLYRIPGPLNDSMFNTDPTLSTRSRNYFSPDIYVPSITFYWKISPQTKINFTVSAVLGNRSSVQLDAFANIRDSINPITGTYKNRQVDIDRFNSKTAEFRMIHKYHIGKFENRLATGFVYMNNDLHRQQQGTGTTASDYDLALTMPGFGRDIHFKTNNIALFAENAFRLNKRLSISPGIRVENGDSKMNGIIKYYMISPLPTTIKHHFVLLGISSQFDLDKENSLYGGISQAYRPVIFKDIVPASTYEEIDKNLKDASGYNAEIGIRGKLFNRLQYDINCFSVLYKNRLGTIVLQDNMGQSYTYKTNTGKSRTNGIEMFVQYKFPLTKNLSAGLFTSTSFMDAKYINGQVSTGNVNHSIAGNKVEAVPEWISRNGIDIIYKGFSCSVLYNYTSSAFSDALNTMQPPASGAKGFTPAYTTWDLNTLLRINAVLTVRAGIGNIFNRQYFTKRPTFYPGPGIWPSDGRNAYVTLGIRI